MSIPNDQVSVSLRHHINESGGIINVGEGRFGNRQVAQGQPQPPRAPDAPKSGWGWFKHYLARVVNFLPGLLGFRAASRTLIAHEQIDSEVRGAFSSLLGTHPNPGQIKAKLNSLNGYLLPNMHSDALLAHFDQQFKDMSTEQLGRLGHALAQIDNTDCPYVSIVKDIRQKILSHDLVHVLEDTNLTVSERKRKCAKLMEALGQDCNSLHPNIRQALSSTLGLVWNNGHLLQRHQGNVPRASTEELLATLHDRDRPDAPGLRQEATADGNPEGKRLGVCQRFWVELGTWPIKLQGETLVEPESFRQLSTQDKQAKKAEVVEKLKQFFGDTFDGAQKMFAVSQLLNQTVPIGRPLLEITENPDAAGLTGHPYFHPKNKPEHYAASPFELTRSENGDLAIHSKNLMHLRYLAEVEVDGHIEINTSITLAARPNAQPMLQDMTYSWEYTKR